MSDPQQLSRDYALLVLFHLYKQLIRLVDVVLGKGFYITNEAISREYFGLVSRVEQLDAVLGTGLPDRAKQPFDSLYAPNDEIATEWEVFLKADCNRRLGLLEKAVLRENVSTVDLPDDLRHQLAAIADRVSKYEQEKSNSEPAIDRHLKTQYEKWLKLSGKRKEAHKTIDIPPGFRLEDVEVKYVHGHNIQIKVPGASFETYSYEDLGFAKGTSTKAPKPTVNWLVFVECIRKGGILGKEEYGKPSDQLKQIKRRISIQFKKVFETDEDIFYEYKDGFGWILRLKVIRE